MKQVSKRKELFGLWLLLIMLFIAPAFIQFDFSKEGKIMGVGFSLPRVISGDEPHYLVMIHSLLDDEDVQTYNNYQSAWDGESCSLGYNYVGRQTDTRVAYFRYGRDVSSEFLDIQGILKSGIQEKTITTAKQIPQAVVWFPFILSLFVWPFSDCLREPMTLLLSLIVSITGLLFFYKIIHFYSQKERHAIFFTGILALGTPVWFYAKALYPHSFVMTLLICSYYFMVVKKNTFFPGILLGAAYVIRPPIIVLIVVFFVYLLLTQKFRNVLLFLLPLILWQCFFMVFNFIVVDDLYGSSMRYFIAGPLLKTLFDMIFSPTQGLLPFSPVLFFTALGIKYAMGKREMIVCLTILIIQLMFYSIRGIPGGIYSARYLVEVIPFMMIIVSHWFFINKNLFFKKLFYVIVFVSVFINFQAAFLSPFFVSQPVWILASKMLDMLR